MRLVPWLLCGCLLTSFQSCSNQHEPFVYAQYNPSSSGGEGDGVDSNSHQPEEVLGQESLPARAVIEAPASPVQAYRTVYLSAAKSENALNHSWSVFAFFDVSVDAGADEEMSRAIELVKSRGGEASAPDTRDKFMREFDEGQVLALDPIPGTYLITLTVAGEQYDLDDHQVKIVVKKCGDNPDDPTPPDDGGDDVPDPPEDDALDFSDEVRDWLSTVPVSARTNIDDLAEALVGINRSFADSKDLVDAAVGLQSSVALGGKMETIEAWKPFFAEMNSVFKEIRGEVTLEEYKKAVSSVGEGLKKWK